VNENPDQPREEPTELEPAQIRYGASPADDGKLAFVPIGEVHPGATGEVALDGAGRVLAHLNGDGSDTGQSLFSLVNVGRGVTQYKNFWMARSRAVGFNEDSALAIEWNVERFQ